MRNVVFENCLNQFGMILLATLLVAISGKAQTAPKPVGTATPQQQKSQQQQAPGSRKASTVTTDRRTGRLVRTVVVAPKVVETKPVEAAAVAVPAGAPDPSIDRMVEESAKTHGVDPLLVHSVIKVESNYNPKAVSNKGAQGLMQLMPATARDLGVKHPMDPKENIEGGVKYLKYLQSQFSDPALALAAYNAGEGAVKKYKWIPPYPETQDYVVKVARNYSQARAAATAASAKQVAPQQQSQTQKQQQPVATAAMVADPPPPPEPPPAPIQSYYDAQGRLTFRTVK